MYNKMCHNTKNTINIYYNMLFGYIYEKFSKFDYIAFVVIQPSFYSS